MMVQEGYCDCTSLPSSGGLRRRSSAKLEDRPVDTGLHNPHAAKDEAYTRAEQRACTDEDAVLDCRVARAVSDPGYLREEAGQDATASPSAAGMLGRIASLSAAAINSTLPGLPLLRGFSSSTATKSGDSFSSDSSSDTTQQQREREYLARLDTAATTILLTRDCDLTHTASRRHSSSSSSSSAAARPSRDPEHLISATAASSASSGVSCKRGMQLAGHAAAGSGYMDAAMPAGAAGVPGARLLLATAAGVGKGGYTFKSDKNPKKSD